MLLYLRMACPYFEPWQPAAGSPAGIPKPLGDVWLGACGVTAAPAADEPAQLELCNFGYAGGKCAHFRPGEADAVRFTITSNAGTRVRILWSAERDHLPFAHGSIDYDHTSGSVEPRVSPALDAQARAYAVSYLRRKTT